VNRRLYWPIALFCLLCLGCSFSIDKVTKEERLAKEYLNEATTAFKEGDNHAAVLYVTNASAYVVRRDSPNLTTSFNLSLLKLLQSFREYEPIISFCDWYRTTGDYGMSNQEQQQRLTWLYIDTLIKMRDSARARQAVAALLQQEGVSAGNACLLNAFLLRLAVQNGQPFSQITQVRDMVNAQRGDKGESMLLAKYLALYYVKQQDNSAALQLLVQFHDYCQSHNLPIELAWTCRHMARIYGQMGKQGQAAFFYNKAMIIATSTSRYCHALAILDELTDKGLAAGNMEELAARRGRLDKKCSEEKKVRQKDKEKTLTLFKELYGLVLR